MENGRFCLAEYMEQIGGRNSTFSFSELCTAVGEKFLREWEENDLNRSNALAIQKRAIIGYDREVVYFKNRIHTFVKELYAEKTAFPAWYADLEDGIYHENWGLAGIAQWFSPAYGDSSSAKIIGDRIYFLESGRMVLKPQKISRERREQMIRAFLLLTPEERLNKDFHELYLLGGTRVTIFKGAMVKKEQDVIIFRRYIVPAYTFEEQALRGTIPQEAIPLFREMVKLGFNVAFTGPVRSAKTTFLSTWQSYEDRSLEGVMVETDPEVPLHRIMPEAPILQILADGEKLKTVTKNLLRSDADYMILAEARDGVALDAAVKIASKGTRRMKITFHTRAAEDFPYDAAGEIVKSMGGDMDYTAGRVAASFDYIFHFIQLKDKSRKRLKSIHEIGYDKARREIVTAEICRYDFQQDSWRWYCGTGAGKKAACEEDPESWERFCGILSELSGKKASE